VDDCADTRVVFTHILERLGAEVVTASDGETGIKAVAQAMQEGRSFSLILLDIRMPDVNGVDAATSIRKQGFHGLIAACTASVSGEGRSECQESGFNLYFDKRVVNKELFTALLDQADSYPK